MPKYTITNKTASIVILPISPSVKMAGHQQQTVVADAHDMGAPAMVAMVNKGMISVSAENDPDTPDVLEVSPSSLIGGREVDAGSLPPEGDKVRVGSVRSLGNEAFRETAINLVYVETTGNDVTGDGSVSAPFATPQRAFDEIPEGLETRAMVYCGAGTFEFPTLYRTLSPTGAVTLRGSLSSEYLDTSAVVNTDFSAVAGLVGVSEATCPAHAGLSGDDHFSSIPGSEYGWAYTIFDTGAGTTIRVSATRANSFFSPLRIYAYTTTLTVPGWGRVSGGALPSHRTQVYIGGVKIVGGNKKVNNVTLNGCSIDPEGSVFTVENGTVQAAVQGDIKFSSRDGISLNTFSDGEFRGDVLIEGDLLGTDAPHVTGAVLVGSPTTQVAASFDTINLAAGGSIDARYGAHVVLGGNMSTTAANTSFITATEGARITRTAGVLTTVALQGRLLTLSEGAVATGMEVFLAGSTNAAAAGEEVKVGSAAAQTIASLPATDATELCRAT